MELLTFLMIYGYIGHLVSTEMYNTGYSGSWFTIKIVGGVAWPLTIIMIFLTTGTTKEPNV